MPSPDTIRQDLLRFVTSRVPAGEPLDADTDLLEADLLDSLLIMDVVAHVEATYGVRLENADIAPRNVRSVSTLAALVASRAG